MVKAKSAASARAHTRRGSKTPPRSSSSALLPLYGKLEQRLGKARLRTILEMVERETLGYVTETVTPREAERSDLQRLRDENAARVATLRGMVLDKSLSSDEVKPLVGRSRPTVNKMAKEGALLAVPDGRILRFPRWQFDARSETGLVPGLMQVLSVMDASPLRKAAWFVHRNPRFGGRTPLELLHEGDLAAVLEEAKSLSPA